jgi:hypothetical protein
MISSLLPDLIHSYIVTRAERLRFDKESKRLKEMEDDLSRTIIAKYREESIFIMGGLSGNVKMHVHPKPKVENPDDWDKLYAFIQETGRWELLHKRVTESVVEELWENGVEVPGVVKRDQYTLSVQGADK